MLPRPCLASHCQSQYNVGMKNLWLWIFPVILLALVSVWPVLATGKTVDSATYPLSGNPVHPVHSGQAAQAGACPGAIISSHRVTARYEGDLHEEGLDEGLYLQLRQNDGSRLLVRARDGLPMPEFAGRVGQLVDIAYTLREYWAEAVGECVRENVFASASFPPQERPDQALNSLRRQAEGGDAVAALRLGLLYAEGGQGLARDHGDAYYWYSVAAASGSLLALHYLGNCHREGQGTTLDQAEAFRLYEKAARAGLPVAYKDLGDCYLSGIGVAEDRARARQMYLKASELGNHEAGIILEALGALAVGPDAREYSQPGDRPGQATGLAGIVEGSQGVFSGDFMSILGEYRLAGQTVKAGKDPRTGQERESPGRLEIFRTVGDLDGGNGAESEPFFLVALLEQDDGALLRLGEGLRPRPAGRAWQVGLKSGNLCRLERKTWQAGPTAGTDGLPGIMREGLLISCDPASPLDGLWLSVDSADPESRSEKPAALQNEQRQR